MQNPEQPIFRPETVDSLHAFADQARKKIIFLSEVNTRSKERLDKRIVELRDFIAIIDSVVHNMTELQDPRTIHKLQMRAIELQLF